MPYHLQPRIQDAKDRAFGLSMSPIKTLFTLEPGNAAACPKTEDREAQANTDAEELSGPRSAVQDPVDGIEATSPLPSVPFQIRAATHLQGQRVPLTPPQSPRLTAANLRHPLRVEEQRHRQHHCSSADAENRLFFVAVGLFLGVYFLYWWVKNQDSILFTIVSRWRPNRDGHRPTSEMKDTEPGDDLRDGMPTYESLLLRLKGWVRNMVEMFASGLQGLEDLCRQNGSGTEYISTHAEPGAAVGTSLNDTFTTSVERRGRDGDAINMTAGHFFPVHQMPALPTVLRRRRNPTTEQTIHLEAPPTVQDVEGGLEISG